tara:strand:+ start:2374 stop:3225 length:852 start_codon:yes stop_codon:yes gene_type:complete
MSFFKKLFSSETKTDKKTRTIVKKGLNPEHKQIVELYIQKNPTPFTSKDIIESIAEELEKKPGRVRSILSMAGVYVKQEKLTWRNDKKLALERGGDWLGTFFPELSETLQLDRDIAELIAKDSPFNVSQFLPDKFKKDREFMLKAIEMQEGDDISTREEKIEKLWDWDSGEYFKDDKELILAYWNNLNPETRLLDDIFMHKAFRLKPGEPTSDLPELCNDETFMLDAVREHPLNFSHAGPDLICNSELLDIVEASSFSDYLSRVRPGLSRNEPDEDDEVIEIP